MSDKKITISELDSLVTEVFELRKKVDFLEEQTTFLNIQIKKNEFKIIQALKDVGVKDARKHWKIIIIIILNIILN